MNKNKVLIPVIVILAVAVLAGGYWTWQRWEQQRTAEQFFKGLATLGGGNASDLQKLAEEMDKFGGGTAGGEEEAAQTPEEKFNVAEEIQVDSAFVRKANNDIRPIIKEVFGEVKISSFVNNYFGMGEESGMVEFTIKREATSSDINKLSAAFTSRGFTIITSGFGDGSGSLMAGKDNAQYTLSYESGGQEVTVIIFSAETTE